MQKNTAGGLPAFGGLLSRRPDAWAVLEGGTQVAPVKGIMRLYQTGHGVVISATVRGLPTETEGCGQRIFAFHIHAGKTCEGEPGEPFSAAMGHYNPADCPHPFHAGDMPPLFGNDGIAFSAFLTNRFAVREVIGRTAIIHANVDDFTTQPAGGAGQRIACGVIRPAGR